MDLDLNLVSHVSDESRSFVLTGKAGNCLCVVSVEGDTTGKTMKWLREAIEQRFERTIVSGTASDEKAALVGFFQSCHRKVFTEIEQRGRDVGQVSMVVANAVGETVVLASVGNCAAYRLAPSRAETLLPPGGAAEEPSFLGQTLKVRVEMTRQKLYPGASYVLSSEKLEGFSDWAGKLEEALGGAGLDSELMAAEISEGRGSAIGILEIRRAASDGSRPEDEWYKELRDELIRASGEGSVKQEGASAWRAQARPGRRRALSVQGLSVALAVGAVAVLLYFLWVYWAEPRLHALSQGGGEGDGPRTAVSEGAITGAVTLGSVPAGSEVLLDGKLVASEAQVPHLSASPGTHEVTVRHGELGEWVGEVVLEAGDTTLINVSFTGDIAVSSPPKEGLSVFVDGVFRGHTPCLVESVEAGSHIVAVGGKGLGPWEEEVLVAHEGVAEVQVTPVEVSETGTVKVTCKRMTERGYEKSAGEEVFVDGQKRGSTPLEVRLKPGFHSIRVSPKDGSHPSVQIFEVRAGARHFVQAELGGVEPILIDCREVRTETDGGLVIHAALSGRQDLRIAEVTLYLKGSSRREARWLPMVLVPGSRSIYAAAVPKELIAGQDELRYFARATTSNGMEYFSDMRSVSAE
ncbi:MAG: hypothetical protein AMJ46_12165 [Latescibacteria bacterium DG_63]|nr:MAG: hypothetical protein AMJ46_12165 [Latescibacteria bacterium DG_63]